MNPLLLPHAANRPASAPVSRRDFLQQAALAAPGIAALAGLPGCASSARSGDGSHASLSASAAVAAMRDGEMTAQDYAAALVARAQRRADLNAFISFDAQRIMEAARAADQRRASGAPLGALHGLPIPIKDSINTRDYPTSGGSEALRHSRPGADAPIVQRLVAAGAIAMGKTNLHELSMGYTSNNLSFGAVRNPFDMSRIPGGSSGGSAAAVAARMAPVSIAEDTAGSIRVPAALCGIVGFRPTTGRYPTVDVTPLSPQYDQVGPHARNMADIVLLDSVMGARQVPVHARPLRGVRIGIPRAYFYADIDTETMVVCEAAIAKIKDAGAVLVEVDIAELATTIQATFRTILIHEVRPAFTAYLAAHARGQTLDAVFAASRDAALKTLYARRYAPGAPDAVDAAQYARAMQVTRPAARAAYRDCFHRNRLDAMMLPATMTAAPRIGEDQEVLINGQRVSTTAALSRNALLSPFVEAPALVLPGGLTAAGLPAGMEFDGLPGQDEALLGLGLSLEKALGPLPRSAPD